jgi:MurNAc alpha-1-phosphate uridylyltransferase
MSVQVDRAMLLAAGRGERLRPLTDTTPKPLCTLDGKMLIDHVLDRVREVGISKIVVNAHHLGDQIEAHVSGWTDVEVQLSREETLLETGGGVVKALPLLGTDLFFVMNADSFWLDGPIPALQRLARNFDPERMDVQLLLARAVAAYGYEGFGDYFVQPDGSLVYRKLGEVAPFVFATASLMHRRALDGMPGGAFSLKRAWDAAEEKGRLFGLVHDGPWFHVSTPLDLAENEQILSERRFA